MHGNNMQAVFSGYFPALDDPGILTLSLFRELLVELSEDNMTRILQNRIYRRL